MKVGIVTKTNEKGQVVIPKSVRDTLGIDENVYLNLVVRGSGVYLYPVKNIQIKEDENLSIKRILDLTRGMWSGDDWEETQKRREKIELKASKRRKRAW